MRQLAEGIGEWSKEKRNRLGVGGGEMGRNSAPIKGRHSGDSFNPETSLQPMMLGSSRNSRRKSVLLICGLRIWSSGLAKLLEGIEGNLGDDRVTTEWGGPNFMYKFKSLTGFQWHTLGGNSRSPEEALGGSFKELKKILVAFYWNPRLAAL